MELNNLLYVIVIILGATAICVSLFNRLGLGSVVGFIVAGILIGPHTPGPVATEQIDALQNVAQLGVVLFLFIVGLEMQPRQFWAMRREVFGLGLGQVVLTAAAMAPLFIFVRHLEWNTALMVGLGYAMSSTAVVVTLLADRGELAASHGRASFAVLMAQDLSIIPIMALIPLLAHGASQTAQNPLWYEALRTLAVLGGIYLVGHYPLTWALGKAVRNRSDTAFGILLFLGIAAAAWAVNLVGISMTLGAFLMGMLFSASGYRYQIAATVAPFKETLMGLFFISVGMSINLQTLEQEWHTVLAIAAAVLLIKTSLLVLLCRIFRLDWQTSIRTGFALSQVGEFSFVLFISASAAGLLSDHSVTLAYLVISITMIVTPLMIKLGDRLARAIKQTPLETHDQPITDLDNHLVVVGLDEVGMIIALMAEKSSTPYVGIDLDYTMVTRAQRAGIKAYYGDILRDPVQKASGIARAHATFISTTDNNRLRTVALYLRGRYPELDIYARVRTIEEQEDLRMHGIKHAGTTYLESTLFRGQSLLRDMGVAEEQAKLLIDSLRQDDYKLIKDSLKKAGTATTN
jgi:Kef-type K+ transport system membrane component KefB/voltage-gated potassium channel Kch